MSEPKEVSFQPIKVQITDAPGPFRLLSNSGMHGGFNLSLRIHPFNPVYCGENDTGLIITHNYPITIEVTHVGRSDCRGYPAIFSFIAKYQYRMSGSKVDWHRFYLMGEFHETTKMGNGILFDEVDFERSLFFQALWGKLNLV